MFSSILIHAALLAGVQDPGADEQFRYPPAVLPHVLTGSDDEYQPGRPVVNVLTGGRVQAGDAIYLEASWEGEHANRAWKKLTQENGSMGGNSTVRRNISHEGNAT